MTNNKKLIINSLALEITRKCNMQPPCKHCFRGDAEPTELNFIAIDNLLDQVKSIQELCFTGGEPMLNIEAMQHIFQVIQDNNITLKRVSLVTNGLSAPNKFISLMLSIEKYIHSTSNEPCIEIGVSCDRYHTNGNGEEFISICNNAFIGKSIAVLKQMTGANPLRTGKATELGLFETTKHRQPIDLGAAIDIANACHIKTQLYLSAKGILYTGAVATNTYQYIDSAPMICSLNDKVDIAQAIRAYNMERKPVVNEIVSDKTIAEVFAENVNFYIRMLITVQNPIYGFSKSDRQLATKDLTEIIAIYDRYKDINMSQAIMIWLDDDVQKPFFSKSHCSNFSFIRSKLLNELSQM